MSKKGEIHTEYPPEVKLKAIHLYLEEGLTYEQVMARLGIISKTALKLWIRNYRQGKRDFSVHHKKKHKTYPPELKLEAIRLHEEDNLPYAEIMSKLGIVSKTKLKSWIYKYRSGERVFTDRRGLDSKGRLSNDINDTVEGPKTKQQLENKIKRLEMENTLLKKVWVELRG